MEAGRGMLKFPQLLMGYCSHQKDKHSCNFSLDKHALPIVLELGPNFGLTLCLSVRLIVNYSIPPCSLSLCSLPPHCPSQCIYLFVCSFILFICSANLNSRIRDKNNSTMVEWAMCNSMAHTQLTPALVRPSHWPGRRWESIVLM